MNVEQARFNMVEQQIRPWEVLDQNILDLLYAVRREEFVPHAYRSLAFSDLEIPLGSKPGECMWAPKVEARVVQELAPRKTDRVLEIGTGSGYLAALLAHRAHHVHSVEINSALVTMAKHNLESYGVSNVTVEQGDGARGWVKNAPYDVIVLTGSTPLLAEEILAQLKPGGRLFAIVGQSPVMSARLITSADAGSGSIADLFETDFPALLNAPSPSRFSF